METKIREHISKEEILRVANALRYHIESRMKYVHCIYGHGGHWSKCLFVDFI